VAGSAIKPEVNFHNLTLSLLLLETLVLIKETPLVDRAAIVFRSLISSEFFKARIAEDYFEVMRRNPHSSKKLPIPFCLLRLFHSGTKLALTHTTVRQAGSAKYSRVK
jgi:hypothetical protein